MSKKIGFFKIGNFSHTNNSVIEVIKNEFPSFELEILDISKDFANIKEVANLLSVGKNYGIDIILKRKQIFSCLTRTPHIFKKVKRCIHQKINPKEYIFTFQTQSLFDASLPEVPHFVYTDHTHLANLNYPDFSSKNLYSKSWIKLEKTIYKNARINFTMSNNITKSIIEQYSCSPDKVICVYAGINANNNHFENQDFQKYTKKNILFVGVDWQRKGGPQLVEAFKNVLKFHPQAQLTIVGCSPKLDIPNCHVVGRVPLSEVSKYFREASIFCLPTRLEPFGIVFLEAMSYKLPIVASNIGAIPDFISDGENGYLVETDNVDKLAEKLIYFLNNPNKCQEFGNKGFEIFLKRYNWQVVGKKIRENIEPLITK
ncbi:glycosyltransferase family 4 protein [Nostocaceae cyanobacterium CENA369]|uniref:Glycosyltransferase family 4 protein n=1 Tax=Dendronalium phyllosphericum CENA369 TaxID=1725256 RepID=A0A8J7LFI7_9NOST|nr:glycosyltransferase family 4 protein [Dendronalium phyllosphericum]MBH8574153.1 glycosyltransferase family 4 protein [Dendronalium phyllosphericum CENA369]